MTALKVERRGEELMVTLPAALSRQLSLQEKSDLLVISAGDGELRLSTREAETARQVAFGREVMEEFKETFAALAK